MRSLYRNMMLVAAAAMSLASCSKDAPEEIGAPVSQTKTITVTADVTRTQFGSDRTQLVWSGDDQFGVYTDKNSDKNIASGKYEDAADGAFSFKVNSLATTIYAYYPYDANIVTGRTAVSLGIPYSQTWNGPGVLNGKNIPMTASGTIEGSNVRLSFEPIACVLALNVYGGAVDETLLSISLTTEEPSCGPVDMDITQNPVVYAPTNTTVTLSRHDAAEAIAVSAATVDNQKFYANQVYLMVAKKEYAQGAKFVVTTSKDTYTFTTKAALDCTADDFKAINLNLKSEATPEPAADTFVKISSMADLTDGEYVLTGTANNKYYALPVSTPSSGKISGVEITVAEDKIAGADAAGKIWTIKKEENYYSLYSGTTYLYHSKGGNSGTDLATGTAQTYPWNITFESEMFKFAAVNGSTVKNRGMLFQIKNGSSETLQFGGYSLQNFSVDGYCGITLFKKAN